MSLQYPLVSGQAQADGLIWKNQSAATGAPTAPNALPQTSKVTVSGSPVSAAAAGAQVEIVSYTGTPDAGEVALLGLSGVVYPYTVQIADSLQDVLDELVAASAADANWTTVRVDDTIECTSNNLGVITDGQVVAVNLNTLVYETFTGTPAAGEVALLGLSGVVYPYTVQIADSLQDVLDELVALAAGDANWSTARAGDTIECTNLNMGVIPDGQVTSVNLNTIVSETFTGTAAADDKVTLTIEASTYEHIVTTGETKAQIAQALVDASVDNEYWTTTRSGDAIVALNKYPSVSVSSVSVAIVRAKDVYGADVGSLVCTQTSNIGDVASSVAVTVPGTAEVDASVYSVFDGTNTYSYTFQAGDVANDVAVALAALINADYTARARQGAVINVTGAAGVPFTFSDLCTGGAALTQELVCPSYTNEVCSPTSATYWRTQQSTSVTLAIGLISGTSFKWRPYLYNAALNVWAPGTLSAAITANTLATLDVSTADGIYIELSDFAGSGVTSIQATGNGQS